MYFPKTTKCLRFSFQEVAADKDNRSNAQSLCHPLSAYGDLPVECKSTAKWMAVKSISLASVNPSVCLSVGLLLAAKTEKPNWDVIPSLSISLSAIFGGETPTTLTRIDPGIACAQPSV